MLLKITVPGREFFFILVFITVGINSCHHDQATGSEAESAYMADYESPASKWGFMNKEGKMVINPEYDEVGVFSGGLATINHDGLWGYIDQNGKQIIKPAYRSAWAFHEKMARVQSFDQQPQFIDTEGRILKSDGWSAADDFSGGRARVKMGDSFGYIDSVGHIVVQPIFTRGWNFKNGICIVEYQEKLGVIDLKGSYILKPEFNYIKISGQQKIILCQKENISMAYTDKGIEIITMPDCKMIESDGHLLSIREKDKMYLFDTKNHMPVNAALYSNIIYLEESRWAGKTSKGYVLLNEAGVPLSEIAYDQINKYSGGFAAYSKNGFWGYMDDNGIEKTEAVFGLAWDYKEDLARAAFKDGIAFIDTLQKLAFYPPKGSIDLRDYAEGLAPVRFE